MDKPSLKALVALALLAIAITGILSLIPSLQVWAFQDSPSPLPNTPTPTHTFTPQPTATPIPPETATPPPLATNTPEIATPTQPPVIVPPTNTPDFVPPTDTPVIIFPTSTPPGITETPIFIAPTATSTATPGIPDPDASPTEPPGGVIIVPVEPEADPDVLVNLIDTLVLYGAYFALGCGLMVFIALAAGILYIQRRAEMIQQQEDDYPPSEE